MEYTFDLLFPREGTSCQKWDYPPLSSDPGAPELIPMGIADMDFPCPEPVVNAIHRRADKLIFGYTGYDDTLHKNALDFYRRRFGWEIHPDHLFHLNGVVPGIEAAVRLFSQPGDGIIVQPPVYDPFFQAITGNGRQIVFNPLTETDHGFRMDFDGLELLCADSANTMMILCSPQNPTGRVWHSDELEKVLDICRRHSVMILCDEIHCDLIRRDVHHIPLLTLARPEDRVIVFNAPSKTFNIPGLQMACAVIDHPELRARWTELGPHPWPNPLSLAAATVAYGCCDDWLDQLLTYLDENFAFMKEFLDRRLPQMNWDIPEGTYLAWLDCRRLPVEISVLQQRLAKEAGVFLVDGSCYKGTGFLRLNAACPRPLLKEALTRIADFIDAL